MPRLNTVGDDSSRPMKKPKTEPEKPKTEPETGKERYIQANGLDEAEFFTFENQMNFHTGEALARVLECIDGVLKREGCCVEVKDEDGDVWIIYSHLDEDGDGNDSGYHAVRAYVGKSDVVFYPRLCQHKFTLSMLRGVVNHGFRTVHLANKSPLPYDDEVLRNFLTVEDPARCFVSETESVQLDRKILFDKIHVSIRAHLDKQSGDADLKLWDFLSLPKKPAYTPKH